MPGVADERLREAILLALGATERMDHAHPHELPGAAWRLADALGLVSEYLDEYEDRYPEVFANAETERKFRVVMGLDGFTGRGYRLDKLSDHIPPDPDSIN